MLGTTTAPPTGFQMRFAVLLTLSLTACFGSASELGAVADDDADPAPGGLPPNFQCFVAEDCVLAGPTCCDCPTFAIPVDDPKAQACEAVDCDNDTSTCATNVEPACTDDNRCVMACAPLTCLECPNGYALEQNDCLSCTCAPPPSASPKCVVDSDCVRVRNDCCGCAQGGEDTAVAVSDATAFEQGLNCSSSPQCPGQGNINEPTCDQEFEARCSGGSCALLKAAMPADACGRADLPDCPPGQTCQINVDPDASQYGLGVCR